MSITDSSAERILKKAENYFYSNEFFKALLLYGLAGDQQGLENCRSFIEELKEEDNNDPNSFNLLEDLIGTYYENNCIKKIEDCSILSIKNFKNLIQDFDPCFVVEFYQFLRDDEGLEDYAHTLLFNGELEEAIKAYKILKKDISNAVNLEECIRVCIEEGELITAVKAISLSGRDINEYITDILYSAKELEESLENFNLSSLSTNTADSIKEELDFVKKLENTISKPEH